jgi:DNA-directed RNA polymerase specialized sigma24 family protein
VDNFSRGDPVEEAFKRARAGDRNAFAEWMGMVEIPLRRSLGRFARAVDVEVVVQETLLRMWLVARDAARVLTGPSASIKFAFRVARNVALEEIRRCRQDRFVDMDVLKDLPENSFDPAPSDPALARAIKECINGLPSQPRKALAARLDQGRLPDRTLADCLRMTINTFLQNIVRARRLLRDCLERRGVRLEEYWR